jgi:hypothetical protein
LLAPQVQRPNRGLLELVVHVPVVVPPIRQSALLSQAQRFALQVKALPPIVGHAFVQLPQRVAVFDRLLSHPSSSPVAGSSQLP